MVTLSDIEDVFKKLSSECAKHRDDGLMLLGKFLEDDCTHTFCRFLNHNTTSSRSGHKSSAPTWRSLIIALADIVVAQMQGSTSSATVGMLVAAVQWAESSGLSGNTLLLISVAEELFDHIFKVVKHARSFQQYDPVLRQLLTVKEYRYKMNPETYSSLVVLYVKKVAIICNEASSNEESFCYTWTLHVLLENPPGDYPTTMRKEVLDELCKTFLHMKWEDGKLTNKLMECVNTFLLMDGPNLGNIESMKIHEAVTGLIVHFWPTCDPPLKGLFIAYAKIQLKLGRAILGDLLRDAIIKDLDRNVNTRADLLWCKTSQDAKTVSSRCFQEELMELSATILYHECQYRPKIRNDETKRMRMMDGTTQIEERLENGSLCWSGTICFLVHKYGYRVEKSFLICWFKASCKSLKIALSKANNIHSHDSLLWIISALNEFSAMLKVDTREESHCLLTEDEMPTVEGYWEDVWNSLVHALPLFSTTTLVVDSALNLLGGMIMRGQVHTSSVISEDTWKLQTFKQSPSSSALYFIACYFSRIGQDDLSNSSLVRKNLLRSILELIQSESKTFPLLNEQNVVMIPEAIFSVCAGFSSSAINSADTSQLLGVCNNFPKLFLEGEDWVIKDELGYSMEALSEIITEHSTKVISDKCNRAHLPERIQGPLLNELNTCTVFQGLVAPTERSEKMDLCTLVYRCSLVCNLIHCTLLSRVVKGSSFLTQLFGHVTNILIYMVSMVKKKQNELAHDPASVGSAYEAAGSIVPSFQTFLSSPIFRLQNISEVCSVLMKDVTELLHDLLVAFSQLFSHVSSSANTSNMDIDVMGFGEVDSITPCVSGNIGISSCLLGWKLELVSVISTFFSVLATNTWEILYNLLEKESDVKVCQAIMLNLCQNISASSKGLSSMVHFIRNKRDKYASSLLGSAYYLTHVHALLRTSMSWPQRHNQNQDTMLNLLTEGTEFVTTEWFSRIKLIDCISHFIYLFPDHAQNIGKRLLNMLKDTDYRVRLYLARKIVVLFQTSEGHSELFRNVCSSIGVKMVQFSKEITVKYDEVAGAGPHSVTAIETFLITLAHLSVHSEEVEVECAFMISAVAAICPQGNKLACALLDSIARKLSYASRSKYMRQLMFPIIYKWVACDIPLSFLVTEREIFGFDLTKRHAFIEHICPWLLHFLILKRDTNMLDKVSKMLDKSLPVLIEEYIVPIFGLSIAAKCGTGPEKVLVEAIWNKSILSAGDITFPCDNLIKHMGSIVEFLLSVSSTARQPEFPYFSGEIVTRTIKRVVVYSSMDTMDDDLVDKAVTDNLDIFKDDSIFKFLLAIHKQVTDAGHPRDMIHRLYAIEVLIDVVGPKVLHYSTCFYIISIAGNYIGRQPLQGQCCKILSKLLAVFNANVSTEAATVLGMQLQLIVPKLITCLPNDKELPRANGDSSEVILVLHQLTDQAHPLLFDYIQDLELPPGADWSKYIQSLPAPVPASYTSRDQFLKFVHRAPHLSPELFLLSLLTHHKKLLSGEIIFRGDVSVGNADTVSCWRSDPDFVSAVWTLVDLCSSSSVANEASLVLADFISRAGISDTHQVIFHAPNLTQKNPLQLEKSCASKKDNRYLDYGISDNILVDLLKLLKTCLSDESVEIIGVASQTLMGILSTQKGFDSLQNLDSLDRSLLMVHSRGKDNKLCEQALRSMDNYSTSRLEVSETWQTDAKPYEQWLRTLVSSLISCCDDIILKLCRSLVFIKVQAAELLLASALVNIAGNTSSYDEIHRVISSKVEKIIFCDSNHLMKSVKLFLDALNVVRSFYATARARAPPCSLEDHGTFVGSKYWPSTSWHKAYSFSVDYLVAARAAKRCSCDFATLIYFELWCEEQFNKLDLEPPDFAHQELLRLHTGLLVDAFTAINEPDSIYGITLANETSSQIIRYEHEGNWSSALQCYDLLVRSGPKENLASFAGTALNETCAVPSKAEENWKMHKGLMRSLQKTGCNHVFDFYSQSLTNQKACLQHDSEYIEMQYEAAWKIGNWDFSFDQYSSQPSSRSRNYCLFNESLHSCLRALQIGDSEQFHGKISHSKMDLVLALSNASKESTKFIHSTILKLQMLDNLYMAWELRWKFSLNKGPKCNVGTEEFSDVPVVPTRDQLAPLSKHWNFILLTQLNIDLLEPLLAFRRGLLKMLDCEEYLIEHLFQSASTLRKGLQLPLAASCLHELKELCCHRDQQTNQNTSFLFLLKLEEAKLQRAQGNHAMAIRIGKCLLKDDTDEKHKSDVYRLVGKWLAETKSSDSRTIIEDYLKHPVPLGNQDMPRQCRAHFQLAHYTHNLFTSNEEKKSSREWKARMQLRKYKSMELTELRRKYKDASEVAKREYNAKLRVLTKEIELDCKNEEKLQDDQNKFLSLALEEYQRYLVIGGKSDLQVVFRMVSLWFNFFSRDQVADSMISVTEKVQTYKLVPLIYQIASRLGGSKDAQGSTKFQNALASLLKKMATDHPYHTIYQILALENGDRVKHKQRGRSSFVPDEGKKRAAKNLIVELSAVHGQLICQMKQMVEVYIELAELDTKEQKGVFLLPKELQYACQLKLPLVPIVTATIPINPNCQYEGTFLSFSGMNKYINIMNGINAPKVIECIDSDGNMHRQLAKSGNDDLRQDAVMEQFFSLVNMLLENHRDTSERRLRIRTYKVVPFTPSAGVVEWVNRTVPLADYLLDSTRTGGAHARYGPADWTFSKCKQHLVSADDKRTAFLEICENLRPVMHHFFLERFLQPADWFQSRLAYTRSVAASSMVGYIVGLGDRHSANILIDQDTAEVVHIDLGVAFDEGLMLKTPERVPFRLTRDIIDGMGVTGTEGVFRRCCEKTLSVMRENKEALLTIIEVFIHDPLYKWALSPLKALQLQKETECNDSCPEYSQEEFEGNKDAALVMLRVKEKLDGCECGEIRSVEGQVNQLIQDAVDVGRLCQMYPMWAPWL